MKTRTSTKAKTDRVQSTARAPKSYDKNYLLNLAGLYHIEIWDDRITKDALAARIAQAAWN